MNENQTQDFTANEEDNKQENSTKQNDLKIPKLNKNSIEYENVFKKVQKIINEVYKANNENDIALKSEIYNMLSDDFISYYSNKGHTITIDNVLDYMFKVENIDDFSIGRVYKLGEEEKFNRYAVLIRKQKKGEEANDAYIILNVYNNDFKYGGLYTLDLTLQNEEIGFVPTLF